MNRLKNDNPPRGITRRHAAALLGSMAFSGLPALVVAAGPVKITKLDGYSDSVVSRGTWTGQPTSMKSPKSNKYKGYMVVPVDTGGKFGVGVAPYTWDIIGTGFGKPQGSVWLLDSKQKAIPGITITIKSWTYTKITVLVNAPYTFVSYNGARLWVSRLTKMPPPASSTDWTNRTVNLVSITQSRGEGQCTSHVAKMRIANGKQIPSKAYSTNIVLSGLGGLDNGYVPERFDALNYGGLHVGIITTTPVKTTSSDKSITYRFTVSEMNALTDEAISTSTRYYKISAPDSKGKRKVLQMIGSNAGSKYVATGVWR